MAELDPTMNAAAAAFGALDAAGEEPADEPREDEIVDGEDVDDSNEIDDNDDTAEPEGEADDEQEAEPDEPAIDPPVSWDAEAKERFAKLPPDDQRYIAERESQRDKFLQAKATEAAQHRKTAEAVTEQYTQLHRQFAEQLDAYAGAFSPARPDPSLIETNPTEYLRQQAVYEQTMAQRAELAQQSTQARAHAEAVEQARAAQQVAEDEAMLADMFPEWSNPAARTELLSSVVGVARELGWPDDLIRQARPHDIKAVHLAAQWKADAEKYRALQKDKMAAVRAAKDLPKVSKPGAAQPKGSGRAQQFSDSMSRLRKSGDIRDAAAAFGNLR